MPAPLLGLALPKLFDIGANIIDTLFQTDAEKAAAKVKLMEAQQRGELQAAEVQLSAIIAEAKSSDPWTSRARPSFLYVVYIMILTSIPMGVLSAISPTTAEAIIHGVQLWLAAIPEPMWMLFGAGYLGYTGFRTLDKRSLAQAK